MEELIIAAIYLFAPLALVLIGLVVGTTTEQLHFRSLDERERQLSYMLVTDLRTLHGADPAHSAQLVIGEAVIATDYLKSLLATLRKLVGGEVKSYETLVVRARREATVRMLEQARKMGFDAVANVRLETADIAGTSLQTKKRPPAVGILVSGTAYKRMAEANA
jgi:uncharacterized protein YbjQ (UPF0145 family)